MGGGAHILERSDLYEFIRKLISIIGFCVLDSNITIEILDEFAHEGAHQMLQTSLDTR